MAHVTCLAFSGAFESRGLTLRRFVRGHHGQELRLLLGLQEIKEDKSHARRARVAAFATTSSAATSLGAALGFCGSGVHVLQHHGDVVFGPLDPGRPSRLIDLRPIGEILE